MRYLISDILSRLVVGIHLQTCRSREVLSSSIVWSLSDVHHQDGQQCVYFTHVTHE